ncbi:MAG: hypothetical protein R2932_28705 [Caldilineaceae bacterium]
MGHKQSCSWQSIVTFVETEREFISLRTKQGLAAARANGKKLGRPKGSRNKERALDPYKQQIQEYLHLGLNLAAIRKLINPQLQKPVTYQTFKYYIESKPGFSGSLNKHTNQAIP